MDKLLKKDIVALIASKADLCQKEAEDAFDAFVEVVTDALANDKQVYITNFATFTPKIKNKRIGTNPRTHESMMIDECKTVSVHFTKSFKTEINK